MMHRSGLAEYWEDGPKGPDGLNVFQRQFEADPQRVWKPREIIELVPQLEPAGERGRAREGEGEGGRRGSLDPFSFSRKPPRRRRRCDPVLTGRLPVSPFPFPFPFPSLLFSPSQGSPAPSTTTATPTTSSSASYLAPYLSPYLALYLSPYMSPYLTP